MRNSLRTLILSCLAMMLGLPLAQAQTGKTYAITGAKIYTLAGAPIENGTVVIRDGKIAAVGSNVAVPSGAEVINAKGLEVYPGLFDAVTRLGLEEVGAVAATVDTSELGEFNPQVVAATAVHPESELIPVTRANGVTHALAAPGIGGSRNVVGGQASVIHLAGWTIDDMLVKRSALMVLDWPAIQTGSFDFSTFSFKKRPYSEAKQEAERKVNEIADWLDRARHYAQAVEKGSKENFERDLKLEALVPVVKRELPVLVIANSTRSIKSAVEFCEKQNLRMILGGGSEAWKVKDLLKQKNIPVILGPTQALPENEDDPYDKAYSNPGELRAAGVKIAIATFNASDSRTLPYEAGFAVPYGLPHDEALKAITIYPAEILGLSSQLGTIEAGKVANLFVTTGDPLEIRSEVRYLFIKGQLTSLDNKHKQLYEKYKARP